MNENNENGTTHKSEINATMAFTQSFRHIQLKLIKIPTCFALTVF